MSVKNYLLIHGAWHGAWAWKESTEKLIKEGHNIYTLDLPGHGTNKVKTENVSFDNYVKSVEQELLKIGQKVILVGHSMAGFIITQVALNNPEKIEKLVFIAAMLPYENKSIIEILQNDSGSKLLENLIFSDDQSTATLTKKSLEEYVYNGAERNQVDNAIPYLVPQATEPFTAEVDITGNKLDSIPKAYIECSKDHVISLASQRLMQQQYDIKQVFRMDTGHVPMVSSPNMVGNILLKVLESE